MKPQGTNPFSRRNEEYKITNGKRMRRRGGICSGEDTDSYEHPTQQQHSCYTNGRTITIQGSETRFPQGVVLTKKMSKNKGNQKPKPGEKLRRA